MAVFSAIAATFNYLVYTGIIMVGAGGAATLLAIQAGAALLTGAIVYGVGKGVGKALMPDFPTGNTGLNGGTRVQLAPNTGYRVPVVYGHAFQNGIITDAAITSDNQTMTYVLTFSEKTTGTTTLGDIFWNDKKLVFGSSTSPNVTSTIDEDGTTSTDYANNVEVYVYDGNGDSANALRGSVDAYTLVDHWTSTEKNSGTIFAVIKVTFDPEAQLTGLGTITAELTNSLDNPADVLQDFLTDTTYGCSIPLASIDTTSLAALETYSDELITYTDNQGSSATQKRYTINGIVNTSEDCRTTIDRLLTACNSFFTYDAKQGKWRVSPNKAESTASAFQFNNDNIISDIKFSSTALTGQYNSVEVEYPDKDQKDKSNYVTIDLPANQREANEPDNQMTLRMEFVNNNIQAEYLANQQLRQTRDDLVVIFTADYTTLGVDAGDVIKLLETDVYGQNDKLYRVMQSVEKETDDGMITVEFTCVEYNADVYTVEAITEFTPAPNSDISLFNRLGTPTTPTVDNERSLLSLPAFDVNTNTPASGIYTRAELWYDTASNMSNKKLLDSYRSPTTIGTGTEVEFTVKGLASGTYYYQTRVGNDEAFGPYSTTSSVHNWTANVLINPITIIDGNEPVLGVTNGNIVVNTGSIGTTYLDSGVVANLNAAAGIINVPTYNYFTTTNAAAPSDSVFNTAVGRNPIDNDIVVSTDSGNVEIQKGYIHNGTSFVENTNFFSGGLITDGTIGADAIVANSISTGKLDFTPITEIAGQTGATISTAQLSGAGLELTSNSIATSRLTGTLDPANGGTGRTSTSSYVADLAATGLRLTANTINTSEIVGTLDPANGGTGVTSRSAMYTADGVRLDSQTIPAGDLSGQVSEANGGTGTTSFSSALTAQGVGFVSGANANLGDLAVLDNITLAKVTDAGTLAGLSSIGYNDATLTGTLNASNGGTGHTSDSAYVSNLTSQNLVLGSFDGSPVSGGNLTAATIISAGSLLVADSNVTRNSNGGITQINGGVITTGTLNASLVDVTNLNANNISTGTLDAARISTTDLVLPSNGANKTAVGPFHENDMTYKHLGDLGTGAGFYTGYIRVYKGSYPGQVKTISFLFDDGTHGSGSGYDVNTASNFYNTPQISSSASHYITETPLLYYLTGTLITESRLKSNTNQDTANIPFAFLYTGTGTPKCFIYAQGDSNSQYIGGSEVHFVKFST